LRLEPALSAGVQRLSQDTGCTPFMTVLAVYQLVLARYSGQRDVVVGTPVASRPRAELEPLIGLFVNTLALRTRLDGAATFADLLARVRETTLGALSHQDLPFEKLVEALQPERSLDHAPVFQVQMNFQHEPLPRLTMPGLTSRIEPVDTGTAKLDLTLTVLPAATGMALELEYNADLFEASTVERFAGSMRAVLAAVTQRPDVRLDDLDLLSAAERRRLTTAPNPPVRPLAASTAVDLLAPRLWATGAPAERVVATAGGRDLAAGELAARSARVARVLAEAGAGPDTLVGLCVGRSADLLAGLFGVWRAGAAYVPLDPAFPVDRLRAMVADAGVRIVVTQTALRGLVADLTDARAVCVDDLPGTVAEAPGIELRGEHLAYTIFTSGSTGRPKGVAVPHVAVANLLESFVDSLRLGPADRFVAVTTLSFDIAVLELALPLLCGARLVVASREEAADPAALRALLTASGATVMQATPATWRMLTSTGGVPATVHTRLCGGEALPRDLATDLMTGGARLWNVYGPTETTVWSAAGIVEPAPAPVTVGPPIANTRVYTLDAGLRPVPVGVVGEVYLGGLGMARGYHGRAGLTAERFLPDPFTGGGARMYRTGDLARWRSDLTLEFLGRVDHQVKVRGFRIETGEIEAALLEHEAIRDAVVAATTVDGDTRLVAYAVPEPPDAAAALWPHVQTHLRRWLPEYMVPAALVALPELPRTPNGKVDRRALPAPEWTAVAGTPFVPPTTPAERVVAAIWADLLRVSAPIGVHDDFFTLGGHSLSATQVVARIRAALGANVRLRTLFAGPTVAQLAAAAAADPKYRPPADATTAERPDATT
jgi:amino acid adenylation domain-containing protein